MLKKSIILLVRKKTAFQTILFFKFFVPLSSDLAQTLPMKNLIKIKLQRKILGGRTNQQETNNPKKLY